MGGRGSAHPAVPVDWTTVQSHNFAAAFIRMLASSFTQALGSFPSIAALAITCVFLVLGAFVQVSIGLGLGLLAVPVIGIFAPELMPQGIVLTALPLVAAMIWKERSAVELSGLSWLLLGRVLGIVPALVVLSLISARVLQGVLGVMTLLAVLAVMQIRGGLRITPASQTGVGFLSGFAGTATGIGGPPVALLYAGEQPAPLRMALSVVGLLGSLLGVVGYAIGGRLHWVDFAFAALCLIPVTVGFAAGVRLRGRIPVATLRVAVLAVVTLTALVLLSRAIMG